MVGLEKREWMTGRDRDVWGRGREARDLSWLPSWGAGGRRGRDVTLKNLSGEGFVPVLGGEDLVCLGEACGGRDAGRGSRLACQSRLRS